MSLEQDAEGVERDMVPVTFDSMNFKGSQVYEILNTGEKITDCVRVSETIVEVPYTGKPIKMCVKGKENGLACDFDDILEIGKIYRAKLCYINLEKTETGKSILGSGFKIIGYE